MAAMVLIGGLLGVLYAWLDKPRYQSRVTFALEDNSMGANAAMNLAAQFGLNIGSGNGVFAGDNIIQIITSRHIVENVLRSPDSTLDPTGKKSLATLMIEGLVAHKALKPESALASLRIAPHRDPRSFSYQEDSLMFLLCRDYISKNLIAFKPDKKLSIYEVRFVASNERFSKVFTERLLDETRRFYTEIRAGRSRQTLEILEERVAAMKGSLQSALVKRAATQDANLNQVLSQGQAKIQQGQIDVSVYGGAYGELYKNLELARLQYLKDVPLFQVIDEPRYPLKNLKLGRLKTGLLAAFLAGASVFFALSFFYYLTANKVQPQPESLA